MASSQEIIPVGEAATALYDDTSMNGSNGPASPIVVKPGGREGPTEEMPERAFYMCSSVSLDTICGDAPQFHWTYGYGDGGGPAGLFLLWRALPTSSTGLALRWKNVTDATAQGSG